MADKRISQLVERVNIANNDVLPIVASGATTTNKVTVSTLQDWMQSNLDVGVTSVGLSMPSAFVVSNSPVTASGNISVTGAGTVSQYIRGDGSLADFPSGGGGGGASVNYYLNGSVSQGTIGGIAYYEMNKVPILGTGTDFVAIADGYLASFITDAGDPSLLQIPGGNWNFETYFSASSGGGTPTFYVELYKVDSGGTATLIASNSGTPELIAFGTTITPYFSTLAVPTTTLALTDRLALRYYVARSGRTITMHTENSHLCQIITTFTTGLTALNGLTAQVQNFATGTSGTDFNILSASTNHTFNLPTASGMNRGALSSADWTTFNSKVSGTLATGQVAFGTAANTVGGDNGLFWDNTNKRLGVGTNAPAYNLQVNGRLGFIGDIGSGGDRLILSGDNVNILLDGSGVGGTPITQIRMRRGVGTSYSFYVGSGGTNSFLIRNDNNTGTIPFFISSANNVGIGTTTDAGFRLDVNGTVNFISGTNDITYLRVGNNSARQLLFSNFTTASRLNAGHLINASDSSGTIAFATASVERWRITSTGVLQSNGAQTIETSTGNLTLATAAGNGNIVLNAHGNGNVTTNDSIFIGSTSGINYGGLSNKLSVATTNYNLFDISRFSNDNDGARLYLGKSRGSTVGSSVIVQNGDLLGTISFEGDCGEGMVPAASISAEVDGVPGLSSDMPGRLIFRTCADNTIFATERMRITSGGAIEATGTIRTGNLASYTAQPFKVGPITNGILTPNAYIRMEINGTPVNVLIAY